MRGSAILLSFVLLLAGCSHQLRTERPADPLDPRGCAARGGHVERRGMFGGRVCVTPYSDAGRTCTDSSQCAGRCLLSYGAPEVSIESHPIGREAAGQCEADSPTFGCHAEIIQGRITQPVCVD